eukprot:6636160-Pyramimonas_sp.AAC.1
MAWAMMLPQISWRLFVVHCVLGPPPWAAHMPPATICALSWTPRSWTPPRVGCFCLFGLFLPPGGAFGSQECRKRIW